MGIGCTKFAKREVNSFVGDKEGETMELDVAQNIVSALANGIDPATGEVLLQRARRLRVVRYDNVQVLTEIEAVLQHLLTVMDEQVVNSLRSHPPLPPF